MTKFSRGSKIVAIAKNPKQMIKKMPGPPRGLDVLQKTVGHGVHGHGVQGHRQTKATLKENNKENDEECFTDEYDVNEKLSDSKVYLFFQELLYGLELLNNAFIHYHKQYLINVIKSLKDKENDYISNMYLCKEAISIYLTLQSEYQYLYSNKIKNCNGPYDIGESKTLNVFKSKENSFYATYIFLKDSKGYYIVNKVRNTSKYKRQQYASRFLSVCENIQENYINASKCFESFINNEFQSDMRVNISASRENGHTKLNFTKFKENLQDYSCDKMTKHDILSIIQSKWKVDNESSKYKAYAIGNNEKEVVSCIKPINLTKSISTNDDENLTPSNVSKLEHLCAVVSAERECNPSPTIDSIQDVQPVDNIQDTTSVNGVNDLCAVVIAENNNKPSPTMDNIKDVQTVDNIQDTTSANGVNATHVTVLSIDSKIKTKDDSQLKVMIYFLKLN